VRNRTASSTDSRVMLERGIAGAARVTASCARTATHLGRAPMPCSRCGSSRSWERWRGWISHRWPIRRDRSHGRQAQGMCAPDGRCWHRTDHCEPPWCRDGTGDVFSKGRDFGAWLGLVPKRSRRERTADPRQNLEARQSLRARSVCARRKGLCWSEKLKEPGTLRAQILDRSPKERLHTTGWRSRSPTKLASNRRGGDGKGGGALRS